MASKKEEYVLKGEDVVKKVSELIKEGNAHKITIKNPRGEEVARFSLTLGVMGAALAPVLAAIGAIAAVLTSCTVVVEKKEDNKK
ncbi:MAG TPA: DUF4342 domain-containing protein [bacterium]|jgi:hypothetical protein|nr:DUF4342 domain-containing protein [bacterium]HOR57068.1 DUF4342 domain-containing protein [bacterium]HPL55955.1 DUF4342 domain-containing protein [bacterium]HPM27919.1 DUF4342 domain-containing protein [bacterium]